MKIEFLILFLKREPFGKEKEWHSLFYYQESCSTASYIFNLFNLEIEFVVFIFLLILFFLGSRKIKRLAWYL